MCVIQITIQGEEERKNLIQESIKIKISFVFLQVQAALCHYHCYNYTLGFCT